MKIEIEEKPARRGHASHRSGSGHHNSSPKRCRTRQKQLERDLREHD